MKENIYPIGTRVRIKPGTRYYGVGRTNPINVEGTITHNKGGLHLYSVDWDNRTNNSYDHKDLELVITEPKINNTYEII